MNRRTLLVIVVLALLAHALLFVELPSVVQTLAIVLLTVLLPGFLLVEGLVGRGDAPLDRWERTLYSLGAGYGVMTVTMLAVSYLPGPIAAWQTLAAYDLVLLLLLVGLWWDPRRPSPQGDSAWPALPLPGSNRWLLVGFLVLLVVAGSFRFVNLGYSEFQGDEARAALRAAAVIQGDEDVLMLHKKGPSEILIPTTLYALTGDLTEGEARFPFALANLAGVFGLWVLGWRLFGPVAGWTAAILLALDGYFIGFSRIVQYQSIILLTSVLAVLILYRIVRTPRSLTSYLTLAGILTATGLLSHYEAVWVAVPAVYLLWILIRGSIRAPHLVRSSLSPLFAAGTILSAFYVPFLLHPNFSATYTYLTERRIGGSFPYNNLEDFFLRTTLYSTTYHVVLMIALVVIALLHAYRRGLGRLWGVVLGSIIVAGLVLTSVSPTWLTFGTTDYVFLLYAVALAAVWLAPNMKVEERTLWLWFGVPFLVALFFTLKPRTHVYVFFMPWLLLAGMVVQQAWQWLRERTSTRTANVTGATFASIGIAVFGIYAYWYFIHNQVEILRTWNENHPAGFWTVYDTPDDKALFGFPLANGWKVVGSLYESGEIQGDYATNEAEAWVPNWYTRGQRRCTLTANWYFQIDNLEPFTLTDRTAMENYLAQGFQLWGVVEINDAPRMRIYQRTDQELEPRVLPLEEWAAIWDRQSHPDFPLSYPEVDPSIANPLRTNLDNKVWLEGYKIDFQPPLEPGETFMLTLYWRAQQPVEQSYKVFNQLRSGDGGMIAQLDSYPLCGLRPTTMWDPGELITDTYTLQVRPDAPPGVYPLYSGLYLEGGDRLSILDEAGNPANNEIHITDLTVEVE